MRQSRDWLASKHVVRLRQSYLRIAKHAAMMAGRYAHAKQFNRHRRELRILRTRLGRIIRDIRRKIVGKAELEAIFAWPLSCASQIRSQQQRQRGWKLYSFHAPEGSYRAWREANQIGIFISTLCITLILVYGVTNYWLFGETFSIKN